MITHSSFVNALKKVLEVCGINSEYSGHYFRRGCASHAFKCNIPAALIKLQGDWKSNAYLRYIDTPLDVRWNMMNVFSDNMLMGSFTFQIFGRIWRVILYCMFIF